MRSSVLAVVVFVVAIAASPEVEESRHQQELREHFHHLSYIAEYSCHHPQPRTVPVHELLSPYQTRGKAYFPEYTVLHRCDVFAGCCEGAKKCGPIHAHNVHLPFKVTYLEDMGEKHKGEWLMEYVSLDNHTVCGCMDHHISYHTEFHYVPEIKDHHTHEDHENKDHEHKDHEHKDHEHKDHEHKDHEHKDHYASAEAYDHDHKDHYAHQDHDHQDHHYKHGDHDHGDHYGREEYEHKYSRVDYKYPSLGKDSVTKDSVVKDSDKDQIKPDEEVYKSEKRQEVIPSNKKIDSLFITI